MQSIWLKWAALFLACAITCPSGHASQQAGRAPIASVASVATVPEAARQLARWVIVSGDHGGLPFAIVDKPSAMIVIHAANGRLVGASPALLGQTLGDTSLAGVGERTQQRQLRTADLTTPAGRFASEPGRNSSGEAIVWIDYATALAIHRVRPGPSKKLRTERMGSKDAMARRVSSGCVVVPEDFYDAVVAPLLGLGRGLVYIIPESGAMSQEVFAAPEPGL